MTHEDVDPKAVRSEARMRRRFTRRQWARRWGVWRPLLALAAVLVLVGTGAWVVLFSSVLGVDTVEVSGNDHLSVAQVQAAAAIPEGQPLARVDVSGVERRVEALAPVLDVRVRRSLPGTVEVEVTERRAIAVAVLGGKFSGIDAEGVVFRQYDKAPKGLPRVRVVGDVDREALQEAARVVGSLESSLAASVRRVDVETIDRITLVLKGGRTVLWGSGEQSGDKARVLAALVEASKDKHFDVSVPGQPVTSARP